MSPWLEPGCHLPADLIDTFTLPSTGGPVLHGVWQCPRRHRLWQIVDWSP